MARRLGALLLPLSLLLGCAVVPPLAAQVPGDTAPRDTAGRAEAPAVNPDHDRYAVPPESVQRLFATDKNYATLEYASPDGTHFLVPHLTELSTLELMSRETYRLAGLELRPRTDRLWHLDTWGIDAFRFYSLPERRFIDVDLPEGAFASDFTWSPDGARLAFLAHLPSHTEVWTAEPATGRAAPLSTARVLATLGTQSRGQGTQPSRMLQWTPEGTVIALLVPTDRGPEPPRDRVPAGPIVRRTREKPTPSRTFPFLLEDAHDEALFERYTRAQIAELAEGGEPRPLGEPGMYESLSLSPDGRYILAIRVERPFSYRVDHDGFPRRTVVLDRDGRELATVRLQALREASERRGGDADDGPRELAWRPDGAGLSFLRRAPRDTTDEDASRPDRIFLLEPPFDTAGARVVATSEDPMRDVVYSEDGMHAFAEVTKSERTAIVRFDLTAPEPTPQLLVGFHSEEEPLELPGELVTRSTGNGLPYALLTPDGTSAYLRGEGYRADYRPRPFLDRIALADGGTTRIFEGSAERYERPLVLLDPGADRIVVSRESVSDFPDSWLWTSDGFTENLTENRDPFPNITAARRLDFEFTRRDGLRVQGRVSMPVGWREGDPAVPAIFWTYPREYEEAEEYEAAAIRSRNRNEFTHLSWLRWSDIWLTQGYALVYPDIPIVGENYNDTYISSLVDAMYAAIRAVDSLGVVDIDRIGHGGHSYGAFATANILANAPFFRAGIAGDGAYNRSLTPSGFQAERRSVWEAPHTYIEMSPFFRADQIETPLLLYHGGDDDNTGTFPVQSRRMIHALTALGKTAVLYEYPYESHTPRAIENKLDMWARFLEWFDRYVKGPADEDGPVAEGGG